MFIFHSAHFGCETPMTHMCYFQCVLCRNVQNQTNSKFWKKNIPIIYRPTYMYFRSQLLVKSLSSFVGSVKKTWILFTFNYMLVLEFSVEKITTIFHVAPALFEKNCHKNSKNSIFDQSFGHISASTGLILLIIKLNLTFSNTLKIN